MRVAVADGLAVQRHVRKSVTQSVHPRRSFLRRDEARPAVGTVRVVNDLIAVGGLFTFATARSFTSASRVPGGLNLELLVFTHAGAVIVDPAPVGHAERR